jgi:hypothetical protein
LTINVFFFAVKLKIYSSVYFGMHALPFIFLFIMLLFLKKQYKIMKNSIYIHIIEVKIILNLNNEYKITFSYNNELIKKRNDKIIVKNMLN